KFAIRETGRGGHTVSRLIQVPLTGMHNVYNCLAALAAARAMGIDLDEAVEGLSKVQGIPGRLQRVQARQQLFDIFVDYAHTDDALENVLQTLKPLTRGRLICVFGCGGDRDKTKRPRMAAAAARYSDHIIVTSDNPRSEDPEAIIDDIMEGFASDSSVSWSRNVDRREAIDEAIRFAQAGDAILIAGKGHEDYQIVGDEILAFDDVAVACELIDGSVDAGLRSATASRRDVLSTPTTNEEINDQGNDHSSNTVANPEGM
ncbi:MAG: Mur ligase family protein, partial [Phycisphaerae bacterium]